MTIEGLVPSLVRHKVGDEAEVAHVDGDAVDAEDRVDLMHDGCAESVGMAQSGAWSGWGESAGTGCNYDPPLLHTHTNVPCQIVPDTLLRRAAPPHATCRAR